MIRVQQIGNINSNPARNISFKSGPQSYEIASLRSDSTSADMVSSAILPAFSAKVARLINLFSPQVTERTDRLTEGLTRLDGQKLNIAV